MRRPRVGPLPIAAAVILVLAACTQAPQGDSTGPPGSTAIHAEPDQSGIAGTMLASGGRAGTPDTPVDGQILIWPTTEEHPPTTAAASARPLEVVATSGAFAAELKPGWYLIRATELGGHVCSKVTVRVKAGEVSILAITCLHR